MKTIKLSNSNDVIIVDDEDYERLGALTWSLKSKQGDGVINTVRVNGVPRSRAVANIVMQQFDVQYDHHDRNPLNNCKENLRVSTQHQNVMNRSKLNGAETTSKFKGVTWKLANAKWCAQIGFNKKRYHLGLFRDPIEAAKAYDNKAKELFGEFAALNFPQ